MIQIISINYDLLPKFPLDNCFNKLITNLGEIILINCDCKIVRETPENILLHKNLENSALSTRHLSLELSTNMTNQTERNLKHISQYYSYVILPCCVILGQSPLCVVLNFCALCTH
jgi:hypothetical protein